MLVVAIILSAGVGYLAGVPNQRTITLTTTAITSSTVPGLQLFASVKPSSLAIGHNVTIVAGVYNPLQTSVKVNASEIRNPTQAPCGLWTSPMGIRIYWGHYTFANLSVASPLLLYNASLPVLCPVFSNNAYTFQPNSDNATVSYFETSTTLVANETISLSGYWITLGGPGSVLSSQVFETGQYTVLVFDAWGQQLIKYFEVLPFCCRQQ